MRYMGRWCRWWALFRATAFALAALLSVTTAAAERPNMIFVLVDDLRFDAMGFTNPDRLTLKEFFEIFISSLKKE